MKLRNIAFTLLGAVLCACQADTTEDLMILPKGATLKAYASFEEQTKAVMGNDGLSLGFTDGDQIGIYVVSDKNTPLTATTGESSTVFAGKLTSALRGGENIYGYYPYNVGVASSGGGYDSRHRAACRAVAGRCRWR